MNYDLKKGELLGILPERRGDLRGKTQLESGSRWAKLMFGQMVRDRQAIFIKPHEVNLRLDQELKGKDREVHNTIFS